MGDAHMTTKKFKFYLFTICAVLILSGGQSFAEYCDMVGEPQKPLWIYIPTTQYQEKN